MPVLANKEFCARLLAIAPDGKILVIEKFDGHLQLPGGGSEKKDDGDPVLTAIRELFEETGVIIESENPTDRLIEIRRRRKDDMHTWICYRVHLTQAEVEHYHPDCYEDGLLVGKVLRLYPKDIVALYHGKMTETQYDIVCEYVDDILSEC